MTAPAALFERPSVLRPAADTAATIAGLSLELMLGAALIFALVMALLVWAVLRNSGKPGLHARWWIYGGGLVFPTAVVTALLIHGAGRTPGWLEPAPPGALIVGITAHLYWWEVRYRDAATGLDVVTANELHLPVGQPVWIGLSSADVIHSFWVPALAGKVDMVPGRVNHLLVNASRAGVFRGQCAEFCGEQHARMALHVVAEPPEAFDAWLAAQGQPAAQLPEGPDEPDPPGAPPTRLKAAELVQGRHVFLEQRCNACHTVRGVADEARLGPDLTHVGSRLYLGAGTLVNQPANMAHWVAHTQAVKPGARMPSSFDIDPASLQALGAWLASHK